MAKLNIWKCPRCKRFNEDYFDECECGFSNRYEKRNPKEDKTKKDEIDDYFFPNQEGFDGFY